MFSRVFIFLFASSILFIGCMSNNTANSDTVKQTEIYQKYSVSYDETAKELDVTAQYRFGGSGGTTLQLVDSSYVKYNRTDMQLSNNFLQGTFYEHDQQTDFVSEHRWEYQNNDEQIYVNTIRIYQAEIVNMPTDISKNNTFTIEWQGMPVQENETISLLIETSEGTHYNTISTSVMGAREITVTPDDISEITEGAATFQLKRYISNPLDQGEHLGGKINGEYLSKKVAINIVL